MDKLYVAIVNVAVDLSALADHNVAAGDGVGLPLPAPEEWNWDNLMLAAEEGLLSEDGAEIISMQRVVDQ